MTTGLVDAMRAAVADALRRRAAAQDGPARQAIEQRVQRLQDAYEAAAAPTTTAEPARHALADLSALVDRLGRSTGAPVRSAVPDRPAAATPRAASPPPLRSMTAFRGTWSRLRAEQRLRQALAQVPAQAGPLNSSHLVHQVLREMHRLSPAYLDAFMAHVDTLLRLEQDSGGARPPRKG